MALTGHIKIKPAGGGAGSGRSTKREGQEAEAIDLSCQDETGKAPTGSMGRSLGAGIAGNAAAVTDEPSELISSCLLKMQSILVDGKPEGGWSSDGLKRLREGVLNKLNFRCMQALFNK
jgi:hypothetical protein